VGRPCGVAVGPDDNPGAARRSSKARANFDDLPRNCDDSETIAIELSNGRTSTLRKTRSTSPLALAVKICQLTGSDKMNTETLLTTFVVIVDLLLDRLSM
jgi:hypothetical protein